MAEPVLKWAGGKRQLLDELIARFPSDYNLYHEPMFGGGALFFAIEPTGGTINDVNPRLVNFYKQVRDNPEAIIDKCKSYRDPNGEPNHERPCSTTAWNGSTVESYYYQQRALFNRRVYDDEWSGSNEELIEEAALLLYLNRTCFNGLYRQNSDGGFNVPKGSYENPDWVQEDRVRAASELLSDVEIFNQDFDYILDHVDEDDLVYFDPPYEPLSTTANFTDYSEEGFDREDQLRLLETCKTLDKMGVYVILSNSGVMFDLYEGAGFIVELEGAVRAINSDAENRGEVDEIVATNVPPELRESQSQLSITDY